MKSIRCWDDLSRYGILPLTGEACGLSYRLLCDVTAAGKRIIEKALDVANLGLHRPPDSRGPLPRTCDAGTEPRRLRS
jgi:hypothetical protein